MSIIALPTDHELRLELNNEVHARPSEPLQAPLKLSYIALHTDWDLSIKDIEPVAMLAEKYDQKLPHLKIKHHSADFGSFRLKWERHTEFTRYLFISPMTGDDAFVSPIINQLEPDWLSALPGRILVATNVALVRRQNPPNDYESLSKKRFNGNVLVGSAIDGGVATALTDFKIHENGFGRLWVADHGMKARQAGRMIQRLLEVDTYRMLALLTLPLTRTLSPHVNESEQELAEITHALTQSGEKESNLLERLTSLQAEIESHHSQHHYRFSAANAYYSLVERRIQELREQRIRGLQTFGEFTERRLVPAIDTCRMVANRQESLSTRVARATQLLSTRVEMTRREQNQKVLHSMNRRAELQLRLQTTVEGLSIAAITYYIVGLVSYLTKGAEGAGLLEKGYIITAASIPLVAIAVAFGIRRIRESVKHLE